ncbi:alpha-E domain-containing protein [Paenibacillus thalictri]|uniref:Alpha-E domain-containing protein n=1 Tax=Paenibacillus thalictri TaxID=2527873 RepID=A0A4Q9DJF2_9BACL|nr:alpha-E domain-containing protein [Paenibacillus thalictri]TBL72464.1 alpha-E domain-containing protein [Paenibacillus thalictri]
MLNRNAEALFWVGRYMERAENHARLINVHYHIQHELDFDNAEFKWARLIDALGARAEYEAQFECFTQKDVLSFITLDRGYPNSLFSCVSQARTNLRTLREKLPSELWESLNAFYLWLGEKQVDDILTESPNLFYKQIKERTAMFNGIQQSVMLRESEWHFMESGKYLERSENTVRILQSVMNAIDEDQATPYPYLVAVLKSVSSYQAFRKYYADGVSVEHIFEFLIGNSLFPRSIHYSFTHLARHLEEIDSASPPSRKEKVCRQAGKIKAELACLERDDMSIPQVSTLLEGLLSDCGKLGRTMAANFFQLEGATA